MGCYRIFLESEDGGLCMAHVPDLPGCTVRARSRDEALLQLPGAIAEYFHWLRSHGERVAAGDELVEIEVAGESAGFGPFNPGDAAALFPPDQDPLMAEHMQRCLRLMAYSRADLLDLVLGLPDDLLDWSPTSESFSLRRILRHVGNAEEWYVSRIVPPEALPAEWEHDEDLPLFEFLEMERRTCVAGLRALTAEQQEGVFLPSRWTAHPEEPWTARKVLRRFLEHEREHRDQVRQILAARTLQ